MRYDTDEYQKAKLDELRKHDIKQMTVRLEGRDYSLDEIKVIETRARESARTQEVMQRANISAQTPQGMNRSQRRRWLAEQRKTS